MNLTLQVLLKGWITFSISIQFGLRRKSRRAGFWSTITGKARGDGLFAGSGNASIPTRAWQQEYQVEDGPEDGKPGCWFIQ